jgi:hypothetical protein
MLQLGANVSFFEGFRTTAHRDSGAGTEAVVGKPPRKEPAGSRGREGAARYGDLIAVGRVAEAVKAPGSCDWIGWLGLNERC